MRSKVLKIVLNEHGSYLGMEKGCFVVRDKEGNIQRYPLFEDEIGEVVLKSGNMISTGALACMGFWGIDMLVLTRKGKPVATLKSIDDDSHVKTRICQYQALENGKGVQIAKQIVLSRIESQNIILRKYGLRQHDLMMVKDRLSMVESDKLSMMRKQLLPIEGKATDFYFHQIFQLFPKNIRIENRRTFKAYDGVNNTFNLAYTILQWRVYRALVKAKLEPYLGFLHTEAHGKPSLVCDFMELYRCFVDDFLIQYSRNLRKRDFVMKVEDFSKNRIGKREYLNDSLTTELTQKLYCYFESKVDVPRIRHGKRQTIETLINEEALLFAKYLRNEIKAWNPRITSLT
jgi:CRISPR-associated protein Cas1